MTETAVLLTDNGHGRGTTAPLPPANRAAESGNDAQADEKIDREQLLKFGDFPNGDAILQDIQIKADEIEKQNEQATREGQPMA